MGRNSQRMSAISDDEPLYDSVASDEDYSSIDTQSIQSVRQEMRPDITAEVTQLFFSHFFFLKSRFFSSKIYSLRMIYYCIYYLCSYFFNKQNSNIEPLKLVFLLK